MSATLRVNPVFNRSLSCARGSHPMHQSPGCHCIFPAARNAQGPMDCVAAGARANRPAVQQPGMRCGQECGASRTEGPTCRNELPPPQGPPLSPRIVRVRDGWAIGEGRVATPPAVAQIIGQLGGSLPASGDASSAAPRPKGPACSAVSTPRGTRVLSHSLDLEAPRTLAKPQRLCPDGALQDSDAGAQEQPCAPPWIPEHTGRN